MKKQFIFLLTCLALISVACKSGNKEVAEAPMTDTTAVKAQTPVVADTTTATPVANNQTTTAAAPAKNTTTNVASKTTTPAAAASNTSTPGAPDDKGYYTKPEKEPLYPGGQAAFNKYLTDNLKYPPAAREKNIQGTVYADLYVDEHGRILNATIVSKPFGYGLEEEVLRVIKGMPQWTPAEFGNHPVKAKFTVPVKFMLK
jgi:TonB family protein